MVQLKGHTSKKIYFMMVNKKTLKWNYDFELMNSFHFQDLQQSFHWASIDEILVERLQMLNF